MPHWALALVLTFPQKIYHFKCNYAGIFYISCSMFNNLISLILRDKRYGFRKCQFDRRSVSDGQKTCSSKGVSLIGV